MRSSSLLLLLYLLAWLGQPEPLLWAQETIPEAQHLLYENTPLNLHAPPTPQLFRLGVEIAASGRLTVHLLWNPAWIATPEPEIRLTKPPVAPAPTESEEAPRIKEGENLQQILEETLDRAHPKATSPQREAR